MARKSGMMFMTEGAENLLGYMLLVRRMVRSVVSVMWGMVRSVVYVVWEMERTVVGVEFALAFELVIVFVARSVVVKVVVFVFVAAWRGRT